MPEADTHTNLTGSLLLAVPSLKDPNFRRAVIFMAAHSEEEGAFGYVLNRQLDQRVADLLPDQELGPLGQVPVFIGGPVSTDKLAFSSLHWNREKGTLRCQTHLTVQDAIEEIKLGHIVRGFVGYTGWAQGQVEDEIKRQSWIVTSSQKAILTTQPVSRMWSAVLENMGPVYQVMAGIPEKVELN